MSESPSNGKEVLRQIIEGLEGVTPSPWEFQPYKDTGHVIGPSEIVDGGDFVCVPGNNDRLFIEDKANTLHLSRCHPDAMRAIAEYAAALEADLRRANELINAALEDYNDARRTALLEGAEIAEQVASAQDHSDFGLQETAPASTALVERKAEPVAWTQPSVLALLAEDNDALGSIWNKRDMFEACGWLGEPDLPEDVPLYSAPPAAPVTVGLPQDVINLVIAAREFWDANNDLSDESQALDKALDRFSSLVSYENEPEGNEHD